MYGQDEMSTINQRRLVLARRIVQKLTVASAMTDNPVIGPRTISTPFRRGGKALKQIVSNRVSLCKFDNLAICLLLWSCVGKVMLHAMFSVGNDWHLAVADTDSGVWSADHT